MTCLTWNLRVRNYYFTRNKIFVKRAGLFGLRMVMIIQFVFHNFSNKRRLINAIWEATGMGGEVVYDNRSIQSAARSHFQDLYSAQDGLRISKQLHVIKNFPCFFYQAGCHHIGGVISESKVLATFKGFKEDKSPRPYEWTVELFLLFFELLGSDVATVVEDTRRIGVTSEGLNSTYITLIPKVDHPDSFGYYRPTSLCNILYKLITKIIVERLKNFFGLHISAEQFDFFPDG